MPASFNVMTLSTKTFNTTALIKETFGTTLKYQITFVLNVVILRVVASDNISFFRKLCKLCFDEYGFKMRQNTKL